MQYSLPLRCRLVSLLPPAIHRSEATRLFASRLLRRTALLPQPALEAVAMEPHRSLLLHVRPNSSRVRDESGDDGRRSRCGMRVAAAVGMRRPAARVERLQVYP